MLCRRFMFIRHISTNHHRILYKEQNEKKPVIKQLENIKTADIADKAKGAFGKATNMISSTGGIQQLVIGGVSGWCTGFLATKVGKTVALSVGGSIIVICVAHKIGIIDVKWNQITKKVEEAAQNVEKKLPEIKTQTSYVGRYAKNNTLFAAGFVGGFLIGICC